MHGVNVNRLDVQVRGPGAAFLTVHTAYDKSIFRRASAALHDQMHQTGIEVAR